MSSCYSKTIPQLFCFNEQNQSLHFKRILRLKYLHTHLRLLLFAPIASQPGRSHRFTLRAKSKSGSHLYLLVLYAENPQDIVLSFGVCENELPSQPPTLRASGMETDGEKECIRVRACA